MIIDKKKLEDILSGMCLTCTKSFDNTNINFIGYYIYCCNTNVVIYNKFFNSSLQFNFSLPMKSLFDVLSKLKNDTNTEIIINNDLIILKNDISSIQFPKKNISNIIEIDDINDWEILPDNFLSGLEFASKFIDSNDKIREHIFVDNNQIVSTDARALSILSLNANIGLSFFLKKSQVDLLLKFKVNKFFIKNNLIYFLAENNTVIYFNFLNDISYPDYKSIKLVDKKEINFLNKINFSDVKVNWAVLEEHDKILKIEIEKNNLKIRSQSELGINVITNLEKDNNFKDISFYLNADYLFYFIKSEFGDSFKTYIDDTKICFENSSIKFITIFMG